MVFTSVGWRDVTVRYRDIHGGDDVFRPCGVFKHNHISVFYFDKCDFFPAPQGQTVLVDLYGDVRGRLGSEGEQPDMLAPSDQRFPCSPRLRIFVSEHANFSGAQDLPEVV